MFFYSVQATCVNGSGGIRTVLPSRHTATGCPCLLCLAIASATVSFKAISALISRGISFNNSFLIVWPFTISLPLPLFLRIVYHQSLLILLPFLSQPHGELSCFNGCNSRQERGQPGCYQVCIDEIDTIRIIWKKTLNKGCFP